MIKTTLRITLAALMATLLSCNNSKETNEQKINSSPIVVNKDSSIHTLSFANYRVSIDPSQAARILSFQVDGVEMLTGPSVNAGNWGTSFWTSPQSAWGWPPSKQIDVLPYSPSADSISLSYTSLKDSLLGFVVTKKYSFDPLDSSFVVTYSVMNGSEKEQSVAPWEISRVFPGGITVYAMGEGKKEQLLAPFFKDTLGLSWWQYDAATFNFKPSEVPKLMSDGKGWLAQIQKGYIFKKKFKDISPAAFAKGEAEIEMYANPDKTYIEIEQQGEYTLLQPGASLSWEVRWSASKLPSGWEAGINQSTAELLK
ncbi:MAG: DUF4380 domain-containing protein [Cytophagaceae bacterium]|jgi:hypothetical protein|nr:DUF4380 domain-containing protein [Cytophagaceae bacterium]